MSHCLLWVFLSVCLPLLKSLYSHKNDELVNKSTGAVEKKRCKLLADMLLSIHSVIISGPVLGFLWETQNKSVYLKY